MTRIGVVREVDYEQPIDADELPELTAKICFVKIGDEEFVELKTLGPVDEPYHPDDLQVMRLSKSVIDKIVIQFRMFAKNA